MIPREDREKAMTVEQLWTTTSKLTLKMWEKGESVGGMLKHSVFLGEKASTRAYNTSGLVKYDQAVRKAANKDGISAFTAGNSELCVRHLGVDSTRSVRKQQQQQPGSGQGRPNQRRQGSSRPSNRPGTQGDSAQPYCIKYNAEGCTFQQ